MEDSLLAMIMTRIIIVSKKMIKTMISTISMKSSHLLQPFIPMTLMATPLVKKTKDQEMFFTYDALDRLIEVLLPEKTKVQYTYDYLHRRISKMVYSYQEGFWQDMSTIYFYYDGNNEIGACDHTKQLLELRILGNTSHAEIGSAIAIRNKR